jgi:dethiobiotin synthetase
MSAFFITGTGTDVGKTFVTAGLVRYLRSHGKVVAALKPVVSGFDPAASAGSDPAILLDALGRPCSEAEYARISPFRYRAPLSPDMAARLEKRPLDVNAVIEFCEAAVAGTKGTLFIEGVGGIMVPLDDRATVLDLMIRLRLPIILVAGAYLGTISHILSALDVLLGRGLEVKALVISETADSSPPLDETAATLAHFVATPLVLLRRQMAPPMDLAPFERLAELCGP